jgi:hypothetical protein
MSPWGEPSQEARSIILPGEVGSQIEPRLTAEGIRQLIRDLRDRKQRIPSYILVSEYDRRDLNQDVLSISSTPVSKADQRPEHDGEAIAILEGVMVRSHPDIPRGRARLIYPPVLDQNLPGTGKIIVG